jgi:hypothetical protein
VHVLLSSLPSAALGHLLTPPPAPLPGRRYDWDPHRAPAFIWLQSIFMLDRLTQKESLKCVQDPSLCDTLCGGRFQHEVYGTRNKTGV